MYEVRLSRFVILQAGCICSSCGSYILAVWLDIVTLCLYIECVNQSRSGAGLHIKG
jgi:hypothetical protein